ncbi:type III pantothenate kinase [Bacilli bacterium]|nr:type III pantothenate kinase [Bacilli bacterium]
MILIFETGNTTTNVVLMDDDQVKSRENVFNSEIRDLNEFDSVLGNILKFWHCQLEEFEVVIISSVVRAVESLEEEYCRKNNIEFFNVKKDGKTLNFDAPSGMGADLMANVTAAIDIYRAYVVVIDMGTATTFTVVGNGGKFLGGLIVTGFKTMGVALGQACDLLPNFDATVPTKVISKDTIEAMQSGLYYGYIGMVKEIVGNIKKEVGHDMQIILTGGYANVFFDKFDFPVRFEENLTFRGIKLIYDLNCCYEKHKHKKRASQRKPIINKIIIKNK